MVKKQIKIPEKLGAAVDLLYKLRANRLALARALDEIKSEETRITEHLIAKMPKSDATGIIGKRAMAKVITKSIPQVQGDAGWAKFYAYVKKNNAFDLLQRRLSNEAITERWDNDEAIPGVGKFTAKVISLTKAGSK